MNENDLHDDIENINMSFALLKWMLNFFHVVILLKTYLARTKYRKKKLVKPHILMKVLHGYRLQIILLLT